MVLDSLSVGSDTSSNEPVTSGRGATVLVVDDEPLIRAQIAQILRELGHQAVEAESGQQALALVRRGGIDLMLLDLMMPDLSGIEVCKQVRADSATQGVRIIVISGMNAKNALEESIIAGADDFLAKPVNPLELGVRVRSILRVRDIHDDERRVEAYVRSIQEMRNQSGANNQPPT